MRRLAALGRWQKSAKRNEMQVAVEYPGAWTDVTGQLDADIIGGLDAFVAEGVVSSTRAAQIINDADYVVLWNIEDTEDARPPTTITPQDLEALRAKLGAALHTDVAALATAEADNPGAVVGALTEALRRSPWRAGLDVMPGQVYQHQGNLYAVIQAHRTQSDWPPNRAPALFKRFHEPDDDPWPWVQPLGAHDAYPKDARVLYNNAVWRSKIDANVWAPGTGDLWERLTPEPPPPAEPEWRAGVAYKGDNTAGAGNGDVVTYQGVRYRCWQSHTSLPGWEPPNVPALWIRL